MDKYGEIFRRLLDLSDTVLEGLEHMEKQLAEIRYEESFVLLQDIVTGIDSIEKSLQPFVNDLSPNKLVIYIIEMEKEINELVSCYENYDIVKIKDGVTSKVLPGYLQWQQELKHMLEPFVIS